MPDASTQTDKMTYAEELDLPQVPQMVKHEETDDEDEDEEEEECECGCCKETYPLEGSGKAVIFGCCECESCEGGDETENLCGCCSVYDEKLGCLLCLDCAERLGSEGKPLGGS